MTTTELIDGIIDREGSTFTDDPTDRGGRTKYGIAERSHPEAWRDGPPTRQTAQAIYARQYVTPFAALVEYLDPRVLVALVDDAVLSGVQTSITTLQRVLEVKADGVIGPKTVAAVQACDGQWLLVRLIQARAHRLARIVERDHTQARFIVGWLDRCLVHLG